CSLTLLLCSLFIFLLMILRPSISSFFPYTTLFRSVADLVENENLQFAYKRSKQTLQAVHVCTHIVRFANFSEADFCKSLLGSIPDRKSTRLNSSHVSISYAVFCLKKKKIR